MNREQVSENWASIATAGRAGSPWKQTHIILVEMPLMIHSFKVPRILILANCKYCHMLPASHKSRFAGQVPAGSCSHDAIDGALKLCQTPLTCAEGCA